MATSPQPPYISRRSCVLAPPGFGVVSCTQPLAAECGRAVLAAGGNAADAAVAVAAGMALTEPCSTGLGGDCFALVFRRGEEVQALNGSGRAPRALTLEMAAERAREVAAAAAGSAGAAAAAASADALPPFDAHCVTVPGAAKGWCDTVARWGSGRLSLAQVLAPATRLARGGFPVSPLTAHHWAAGEPQLLRWAAAGEAANAAELLVADGADGDGDGAGAGGDSGAAARLRAESHLAFGARRA